MNSKEKIVRHIENLVSEESYIYTLSWILLRDQFLNPEEAPDIDWHSRLSFQELSFLAGLMVKHKIGLGSLDEKRAQRQIKRTYELFAKLHRAFIKPFGHTVAKVAEKYKKSKAYEKGFEEVFGESNAMAESIFYGDSGAYDFQFLELAQCRYTNDKEWILDNKGFSIETAIGICKKLKKMRQEKFRSCKPLSSFDEFKEFAFSVFVFKRSDINEFPKEEIDSFLKEFSLESGNANKELSIPGEYNEINSHPIVSLEEEKYFVPVLFNLAQSIYESPFYWMLKDPAYKEISLRNRGEATVDLAFGFLYKVFGEGSVSNEIRIYKKKSTTLTDIDLLVVKGNRAIVFQVKSKKLTSIARAGNAKKLKEDFLDAVQEAYDQGIICREAILNKDNILIDKRNNPVVLEDVIDDVYIVCVTSDHYPSVTHQTRTFLRKEEDNPYPITINIFDLEILTYYLSDPFEFLYYLKQRIDLYQIFVAQTEIGFLAYHLKRKLYPIIDEKTNQKVNFVAIDSMEQLIDGHFPVVRGDMPKTKAVDRLHTKWSNSKFLNIIEKLKGSNQPGLTDAIFYLYDLSGRGADDFIDQVEKLKLKCVSQIKSLRFSMAGGGRGVSYVCDYEVSDDLLSHTHEYCRLKKYQTKSDLWIGLGGFAKEKDDFEVVVFNKDPWEKDEMLEEISKKLYVQSKPKSLKTGKNLGRNDPCWCGSNKKFKRCHGR